MTRREWAICIFCWVGFIVTSLLILSGCAAPADAGEGSPWAVIEGDRNASTEYAQLTLPDGRTVECLRFSSGTGGGLSCNWGTR